MIVLGFDTATQATAVALRLADGSVSERRDDPPRGEHPVTREHVEVTLLGILRQITDLAGACHGSRVGLRLSRQNAPLNIDNCQYCRP